MSSKVRFFTLSIVLFSIGKIPSVQAQVDCPFADIGEKVLLGCSIESWDMLWETLRAPELGDRLAISIREELAPALLEGSAATDEVRTDVESFQKLLDRLEWEGLAASRVDFVSWLDASGLPQFTLRLTPPEKELEPVFRASSEFLKYFADEEPTLFSWREEGEQKSLVLSGDKDVESWTGYEAIHLTRLNGSVWITLGHSASDAATGGGFSENPEFGRLWRMHESKGGASLALDFGSMGASLEEVLESAPKPTEPEASSSLVLDETMEALFKDDPETLRKLKQAQEGMEFWSEETKADTSDSMKKVTQAVKDQGIVVCRTSGEEEGLLSATYWLPKTGSEGASLFELNTLSSRMKSLLDIGLVEVGLQGLPAFERIYDFVLEAIAASPDGSSVVSAWESIQESADFRVKEKLIPAFGQEVGWISRQVPKGGAPTFPIATNELYIFVDVNDASTAKGLTRRLEELLAGNGIPTSDKDVQGMTFKEVDTGFFGKAMWAHLEDPNTLVFAKSSDMEYLGAMLNRYKSGKPGDLSDHPRWEDLKSIWREEPTAVRLQNAGIVQGQLKGQLQSAQMMIAMMGGGDPILLSILGIATQAINELATPDWSLRVDADEGDVRVSRTLLLYPPEESK